MPIEIGSTNRVFNLSEARQLLPLVQTLTKQYQQKLAPTQTRLNRMLSNDPRRASREQEYEAIVSKWKAKVEQLGPVVKGLWVVEFDVGDGALCWKSPEVGFLFFRPQGEGFSGRVRLREFIRDRDPDWAR